MYRINHDYKQYIYTITFIIIAYSLVSNLKLLRQWTWFQLIIWLKHLLTAVIISCQNKIFYHFIKQILYVFFFLPTSMMIIFQHSQHLNVMNCRKVISALFLHWTRFHRYWCRRTSSRSPFCSTSPPSSSVDCQKPMKVNSCGLKWCAKVSDCLSALLSFVLRVPSLILVWICLIKCNTVISEVFCCDGILLVSGVYVVGFIKNEMVTRILC